MSQTNSVNHNAKRPAADYTVGYAPQKYGGFASRKCSTTDTNLGRLNGAQSGEEVLGRSADGMFLNTGFGGQPQKPEADVVKAYKKSFSCNKSAEEVIGTIRKDFSKFANFGGRFGPVGAAVNFAAVGFGNTPINVGNSISINTGIYAPIVNPYKLRETINTSVTVTEVDTQNFSFTTVPGHVLYPASISFGASEIGNGRIAFGIHVNGNFADNVARAKYYSGGYDLENKIWRNLINNVRKFCGN